MNKTQIFAHRGASFYAPENTLEAFRLALEQGADGIELDVHLTKDGRVVVIHDETIDRVSDGKGKVRDFTLDELRRFSFHYKFPQFSPVQIPTLEEVMDLVKRKKTLVNIELKTGVYWYPDIEKKTADIVRKYSMEKRVIYSSFNHYSLQKLREEEPFAQTAYLLRDIILNMESYTKKSGVNGIHPGLSQIKMPHFLESFLASGLKIRVWTVNEKEDMRMLIRAGVDGLITNKPDAALEMEAND